MSSASPPASGKKTGPRQTKVPDGDDRARLVCPDCGFVEYVNPRIVVGAVATWAENGEVKFLLAKRAIEPRKGYWTMPAGFLEVGETLEAGAVRETWEEAGARISIDQVLGIYNIARIGQVYIVFRAHMLSPEFSVGVESEEVKLFAWDEIPWDALAFPSVHWALTHHRAATDRKDFAPHGEPAAIHWER
ncbi:MAG: NUDIX hydrolase [Rhodospirillaceae bacterium]|nr:NUDIX hydrolase [Rhodospirillaceae bacterium]